MQHLPHLSKLLVGDLDGALKRSDIIVIGNAHSAFRDLLPRLESEQHVVDLVGHDAELRRHAAYDGACW
jgi:GDP-mannose 6-dehydrogenase